MTAPKIFVDTNVLVYAHDTIAGRKRERALDVLQELWNSETGVISTLVLQELFVSLTQKILMPIDERKARNIVEDLCVWEVVANDEQAILAAIDLKININFPFGILLFSKRLVEVEPQGCTLKISRMGSRSKGSRSSILLRLEV